jgi:NAD+ synthase
MYQINDMNKVATEIVTWTHDWFHENGMTDAFLGISGGTDSTVMSKILTEALGKDHVYGIFMPKGIQPDIDDARAAAKAAGVVLTREVNLELAVLAAEATVLRGGHHDNLSVQAAINLIPRVRTAIEYCIAQDTVPEKSAVVCTANLSELVMGYFTKWADMGDLAPIANLTKTEVRQLGLTLGLPENLVLKTPADGLSGRSDEEKMGFTYEQIDNYIRKNFEAVPEGVKVALDARVARMEFKRKSIKIDAYAPQLTVIQH